MRIVSFVVIGIQHWLAQKHLLHSQGILGGGGGRAGDGDPHVRGPMDASVHKRRRRLTSGFGNAATCETACETNSAARMAAFIALGCVLAARRASIPNQILAGSHGSSFYTNR